MTDRTAGAATVDIVGATTAEGAVTETALPLPVPLGGEDRGTLGTGKDPLYSPAVAAPTNQGMRSPLPSQLSGKSLQPKNSRFAWV
ncbi:hypothetical protein [Nocardia gipuzkoensis]|uniref:hypothetical protein n=1 Tax=Nocardia gipuzkoensis TaxID=2749991 RepID=UPI00237DE09F|nr:hypothetical protein [Nocardia gipuzkoensis]MDE1671687.1 hypothetical protein [Nocardia gipuzkoensis]